MPRRRSALSFDNCNRLDVRLLPSALIAHCDQLENVPLPEPEPSPGTDPGADAPVVQPPIPPSGPMGPGTS